MGLKPCFRVVANGADITGVLAEFLLSIQVTDKTGYESDLCERILADDPKQPISLPPKGAVLDVYMGYDADLIKMGVFIVDEIELDGPPERMTIRARASIQTESKDGKTSIMSQKTRSWPKQTTIDAVVKKIAGEHGLTSKVSDSLKSETLPHMDQSDESDINFLLRVAKRYDVICKDAMKSLAKKDRDVWRHLSDAEKLTKAPIRSGIAVDSTMVCGGIHIKRPRIKQLGDKYETPFIISNSNGNLAGFKNISVIDPIEIDANSSTNQGNYLLCSQNIENLNISDNLNTSKKDLNGYAYEIFHNYMQYFLATTDNAWRSLTLSDIKKGRKFSVINENANGNDITVNFGTNITILDWSTSGSVTLISLERRGSRIEFEAIGENLVRVSGVTSDIVNNSKIKTSDYDFPSLAVGASAYVDIVWSRATTVSFIEATMNINLQGCQLRAQCLVAGTVRVRLTNSTNAPIDLPNGTIRLRSV